MIITEYYASLFISYSAMINLILSQVYAGDVSLISVGFNEALPALYGLSMMWTLNARRSIRHGSDFGRDAGSGMSANSSNRGPALVRAPISVFVFCDLTSCSYFFSEMM